MPSEPGRLVALVTHARHVPSIERERFGIEARDRSSDAARFVLETCHRVEAYGVVRDHTAVDRGHLPPGGRLLVDEGVVRHVVGVAVGLDSVVIGEDQILHQLRETLTAARASGTLDPLLERLFTAALRAGRVARSWRQSPGLSLADLAIGVIERRSGPLRGRGLLVVGAGKMGALAGRSGLAAGASVSLTSRTHERAEGLAARLGVPSLAFDPGPAAAEFAGIVVGLRGPWLISEATESALVDGDAMVVDLSVPQALSEGLSAALRERYVSADDLAMVEEAHEDRAEGPLRRLEALVDETVAGFIAWLDGHERRQTAEALALLAESEREAEMATLSSTVQKLEPEVRDLIDGLSRHLTARLLRRPLERLGQDSDGRHDRAVRELFGL
jgi:glutamyl-tRNA reductase